MKHFVSIVLLLGLAPVATAQKSPHTMMAVFAHPDDEAFIGPLLAHYARQGAKIHLIIMTQDTGGRPGVSHGIPSGPELARVRAEEAQCSCRELGIESPVILEFEDDQLGKGVRPPWDYIARAEHEITQVVQSGAEGAPRQLFYFGFLKDRLSAWHGQEPISGVDGSYLTVRVPYSKDEFVAFQKSFKCYKTQFLPEELETIPRQLDELWGGRIYLRPWFGAVRGDDLFTLKGQ